jgi:hypothetical protein
MGQVVRDVGESICEASDAIRAKINAETKEQDKHKAEIAKLKLPNYRARLPKNTIEQRESTANELLRGSVDKLRGLSDLPRTMDYSNKFKITFRHIDRLRQFIEYSVFKHGWKAKIKHYVKECSFETKAISDWARKCAENSEIYWRSLMSDADKMPV